MGVYYVPGTFLYISDIYLIAVVLKSLLTIYCIQLEVRVQSLFGLKATCPIHNLLIKLHPHLITKNWEMIQLTVHMLLNENRLQEIILVLRFEYPDV